MIINNKISAIKNMDSIMKLLLLEEYMDYYIDLSIYNTRRMDIIFKYIDMGYVINLPQYNILSFQEYLLKKC